MSPISLISLSIFAISTNLFSNNGWIVLDTIIFLLNSSIHNADADMYILAGAPFIICLAKALELALDALGYFVVYFLPFFRYFCNYIRSASSLKY